MHILPRVWTDAQVAASAYHAFHRVTNPEQKMPWWVDLDAKTKEAWLAAAQDVIKNVVIEG